ncbi:Hint domain-containing protein [Sulfitobacter sp. D35]|uniref:Hint domain-containing protein n=1 Tax=Sulfitobacter sp. D35 TaxID=3083252 RepID=UPI00296FAA49|nr:Hint domain-containing protein [Sulfitobacter sp. D35]MDW4498720.1 Hint domain-containing protein [Sulfitobacter sp. D35]
MEGDTTLREGLETGSSTQGQTGGSAIMIQPKGLVAEMRAATEQGWCPMHALQPGDQVLTFDNGLRPLTSVQSARIWTRPEAVAQAHWPVHVPAGALENTSALLLLPHQGVMLECDGLEAEVGDPFALLEARALVGLRGIERRRPTAPAKIVTLGFAQDEVVYTEGGFLVLCAERMRSLETMLDPRACSYDLLPRRDAARFVRMLAEDAAVPLRVNRAS